MDYRALACACLVGMLGYFLLLGLDAPGWASVLGSWVLFSGCISMMTLSYMQGVVRTVRESIDGALTGGED